MTAKWSARIWSSLAKAHAADHWRSRHHLQHDPRIRRDRRDVLHRRTNHRLHPKLTGREDEQVAVSRNLRQRNWPMVGCAGKVEFERVLTFDLSVVTAPWLAHPSPTYARSDHRPCRQRHHWRFRAGTGTGKQGLIPEGAVLLAAITSCTTPPTPATWWQRAW